MKNDKEEKSNIGYKKMVESTQSNIPIRDIVNGITVTEDKKYVKTLEIKPIPFFLKKIREQNRISNTFESLLKSGPDELHFKSISIPTDLTYQISKVENCIENEKNANCKKMGNEYLNRLYEAERYGVTRRFFISFPYTGSKQISLASKSLDEITHSLNVEASRMSRILSSCGNDIISEYPEDENKNLLKMYHTIYNRDSYLIDTFENRVNEVVEKYKNTFGDSQTYIPVTDYIAPKRISYLSNKYLLINDTYYSFLYIPDYGYRVDEVAGWLDQFVTSEYPGVDVDVFLKRIPKDSVINGIRRSIASSRLGAAEQNDVSDAYESSIKNLGSAQYLKNGLSAGNDFYYMSTFITVSSTKVENVAYIVEELKKIARNTDIVLKENKYRCEEMFNIVLPCSQWNDNLYSFKKSMRNVLTEGAASTYLFTTYQLLDKEGLYLADDVTNGSPVILDQFNRARVNNQHIAIFSETGGGKSVLLMLLGLRARVTSSYNYETGNPNARKISKVIYLCPEKQDEYKRITSAIGGQFVDLSSSSKDRINIMEIFKVDEKTKEKISEIDGDDEYERQSYLNRKISTLTDFFQLHISRMSDVDKYELEEAIIKTYAKKGITTDNDSLWADEQHTKYKRMPIISDLVAELEANKDTQRLAKSIKLLTRGNGAMFDGETNVDINNDFVVLGLQHNSADVMGLACFMAMDFASSVLQADRTENKFFILDEFWKFANNPISLDKILALCRLLRAYGTSMVLATQSITDLTAQDGGRYASTILDNCATKILMSMKEKQANTVQDIIGLTNQEASQLTKFKAGQGLIIAGETRMFVQFNPSETEKLLTFTDNETLEKYLEVKKQMEEDQQYQDEVNQMDDINDVFDTFDDNSQNEES